MSEETKENEQCNRREIEKKETNPVVCKAIVAVVSIALYYMYFLVEIISAQIAIAFNIPIHNTSIYLEKMFGIRLFMFTMGVISEFIAFKIAMTIKKEIANNYSEQYELRRKMNDGSFVLLLIFRILVFLISCFSSNPGLHVYLIMGFEAFGIGCVGGSIFAMVPEHGTVLVLFAHISRFLIFLIQFILDIVFSENPMMKIRSQFLACLIITTIATGLKFHYHNVSTCPDIHLATLLSKLNKEEKNKKECKINIEPKEPDNGNKQMIIDKRPIHDFLYTFGRAASPFFMFSFGALGFDVLFPGILPYAFLPRDKCHLINMVLPFASMSGPIFTFILESLDLFVRWSTAFDTAWLLAIPMIIVFVYSVLAIQTRVPSARKIINNRPRVLAMTFMAAFGNSFFDPLSFAGVAKVIFLSEDFIGNEGVLFAHQFFCIGIRFFFYKISVGYNVTRMSLGYHLPKFRPTHRMSKWNTFWYLFRNTFKKAGIDAVNDLKMNVKEYL